MKDAYRERIRKEKEKLNPTEVFFSDGYQKLLQRIAGEIAGNSVEQLILYQNETEPIAGWNDGKRIGINIENDISKSFLELEQKSDSLIGILGHECGHARFTDSGLRKLYIDHLLNGEWYPSAPIPQDEKEAEALEKINVYLNRKNQSAIALLVHCASYISNLLNDMYIEGKMCSLFPGSIRKGILINRRRNVEFVPTLRELLKSDLDHVTIFLNLMAQYALRGYANSWDMKEDEMLDTLHLVALILEQAGMAKTDLARYLSTNQILLMIWKYLEEVLGKLKEDEQKKESQDQPESNENMRETDGAGNAREESASEESQPETCENGEDTFVEDSPEMKAAMEQYLKELSGKLPKFVQESELDKQSLPNLEKMQAIQIVPAKDMQTGENPEKISEVLFENVLFGLVQETVDHALGVEAQNRLQQELDEMEFDADHEQVQKKLAYKNEFTTIDKCKLLVYEERVKRTQRRLHTRLLPILENQKERTEHRLYFGKRLDMRELANPCCAVMARTVPGRKTDMAVAVLVDNSGSMCGTRLEASKLAALTLYDFCRKAGIPIIVYGHHTDGSDYADLHNERVYLHAYAEFQEEKNDRLRIITMETCGSNRDGAALLFMGEKLLKRPEKQKLLFLISDGLPNASHYSGKYAIEDLRKIKEKFVKKGIAFQAAAIGEDKEQIQRIYGNAYLDISDLDQLPVVLTKQLAKMLRRAK